MPRVTTCSLLTVSVAVLLVGCDRLWPDAYWRSERYVLLAIDTKGQMNLSFDLGNGTAVGLVDPTVFSIGADERYIVVQQHPKLDNFGHFNRSLTNYFVIERTSTNRWAERKGRVRGPLTEEQFQKLTSNLKLPPFTKVFNDLN